MRLVFLAASVAALLLSGAESFASTVTLSKQNPYDTFNGGGKSKVWSISNRPNVTAYAGGFRLTDGIENFVAWCLDVAHNLSLPGVYNITSTPFSNTTGSLNSTQIANIKSLFEVNYPTLNISNSTGMNGGNYQSAGFQLALWELIYETSGTFNVSNGTWHADASTYAKNWANYFLGTLSNPIQASYNLVFYESANHGQNLVRVTPVPLPAAGGLLGIGLLALYGIGRRRKSAAAA